MLRWCRGKMNRSDKLRTPVETPAPTPEPIFDDPDLGLSLNEIRPQSGTALVAGETWDMAGEGLAAFEEGVRGGLAQISWQADFEGAYGNCTLTFAEDGKSGTMKMSDASTLPAGTHEVEFSFATRTADDQSSKYGTKKLTIVKA